MDDEKLQDAYSQETSFTTVEILDGVSGKGKEMEKKSKILNGKN